MQHGLSMACVSLALVVCCVACDKLKPPKPELGKPSIASGQASQQGEREAFVQAAQKEIDELRAVIVEFRARAETGKLQTKARLGEELTKLEDELREAQQRLAQLKAATLESWNQLKESFDKSLTMLKRRLESFRQNAL